jgi:hypothetical protein
MESGTSRLRMRLAVVVAFLCPGLLFASLMPLLAPAVWNPGNLPTGANEFILVAGGMSLFGAVLGSPVILACLAAWKLLSRFRLVRYWTCVLIGIAGGAVVGLFFDSLMEFTTLDYARVFSAAGALTGLFVWLTAYGFGRRSVTIRN